MPSQLHEALILLFRNRPTLAPELLRDALHVEVPPYTDVRIDSADLTELQPAEYRADLVILLLDDEPVFGIVVEVQLAADERKTFVWPVYVANLRARLRCPVCLLVVAADDAVARWASKPISLDGVNQFVPTVLGPSGVPEVTDEDVAVRDPELAVLSAMAHGRDSDVAKSAQIALAAQLASFGLDEDRSKLYCDLVLSSLSEAARRAFATMDPAKYEYQSDFARRYIAQGRVEGRAEGREEGRVEGEAAIIIKLLTARFGDLTAGAEARIRGAGVAELEAMAERLLTARTLQDALGS